jgi:hypothetical protein
MVRIGVSGHRFLAEIPKLQTGIDRALAHIDSIFPHQPWAILSSLAEGADRLVVERVLLSRPDARLIVPLPLEQSEYLKDFEPGASVAQFLSLLHRAAEVIPPLAVLSRSEGYWAAGKYMLDHCDVLVTLWDGQGAQGQGGTGEMVAIARQRHLPLAWVHCGNRKPGTNQPTSLGEEQGRVSFEEF